MRYGVLGLEIIMAVIGLIAIVTGWFPHRAGRPVLGWAARVLGGILIIPLAIGMPIAEVMMRNAESRLDGIGQVMVFRIVLNFACIVGVIIAGALLYDPGAGMTGRSWMKEMSRRRRKKRRTEDDDDHDDRRRRRRRRMYEDDDRPRQRERRDEEDDYAAPEAGDRASDRGPAPPPPFQDGGYAAGEPPRPR